MQYSYEISVLIPVYNVEKYIRDCLISVFNNTIINKAEIVLINDGSIDNSMQIINDMSLENPEVFKNIKILDNQINKGIAYTRQRLMNEACGKYLIFIDSDDTIEPTFLEKLYNKAITTDADIVQCNYLRIFSNNNKSIGKLPIENDPYKCLLNKLDNKVASFLVTRLIKHSIITDNNICFDDDEIIFGEDEFLLYRLLCNSKKVEYVDEPLYNYIYHKSSVTSSIINTKCANSTIKLINSSEPYILKYFNSDEVKNYILRRKLFKRILLVFSTDIYHQKIYNKLWPETNSILKDSSVPFYKRIVLRHIPVLSSIILFTVGILKYKMDYFHKH